MQLVTVFKTFSAAEAQLVRSRLEVAGYQAEVAHELASLSMDGYSMATGGILVQVPDDQAEDARSLVTAGPSTEDELK
ncbi:MAG: DUF2007 domain-containing protein [Verrucomicrobia bacterium]|nr:DUF2007 domain-containing protein [Verrucomicrobiota bacterium]